MANEITSTALLGGGMVSEVLSALVMEQLYDPTDLRAIATMVPSGYGSVQSNVTLDAIPASFAATGETAAVANSAYSTSEFELTIAKYSRAYQITDLVSVAGSPIDLARTVRNLMAGVSLTFTDLLAGLFPSFTSAAGTTNVTLDVDDIFDAAFALNIANAQGPYACVLHNRQMNDFRASLRLETGILAFQPASQDQLATKGPGYQGSWNGVDFWQSDSVIASAPDRIGAMMTQGAVAYQLGNVQGVQGVIPAANKLVSTPELVVELVRDGLAGMSSAVAHMYPAVKIAEQARGVKIISKSA